MSVTLPQDPIQTAILDALTASEELSEAVQAADAVGTLSDDLRSRLDAFRGGKLTAECFTRPKIDRLNAVAKSLEPAIRGETRMWVVHDECSVSGGYEETATSALGDTLSGLQGACRTLADRMSLVVKLQDAENLAAALIN